MAVFKEKNGALKAGGYLHERTNAQIRPGRLTFEQSISLYPQIARGSGRAAAIERYRLKNKRKVRAAMTAFEGSIRKGGGSERKIRRQIY